MTYPALLQYFYSGHAINKLRYKMFDHIELNHSTPLPGAGNTCGSSCLNGPFLTTDSLSLYEGKKPLSKSETNCCHD